MRVLCAAALAACALPAAAAAQPAVGVLNDPSAALVRFDTATPGSFGAPIPITGLQAGEMIRGLDFRFVPAPATGRPPRLFALGIKDNAGAGADEARIYTLDAATGVATQVGTTAFANDLDAAQAFGFDFNPAADRLRIVNGADRNLRANPDNGARADAPVADTNLDAPANEVIAAAAYDRVDSDPATPTTLFDVDFATDGLFRQGGPDGNPNPNFGALTLVGDFGFTTATAEATNFDISPEGLALMTLARDGIMGPEPTLYVVNTATGNPTPVGALQAQLRAFAVVPAAPSVAFTATAFAHPESGEAVVTVTRSGPAAFTSTVTYATSDGTAGAGDYTATTGTLTFAPDEVAKTFAIPVTADTADEPDETVDVALSAPDSGTLLGTPAALTVTITDDDVPVLPPADTTAPTVAVAGVKKSMSRKAFLKGVTVRVTPDEPAALSLSLTRAKKSLASADLALAAGERSVTLKPRRKGLAKKKAFRARLRIVAVDAATNSRVADVFIKVRKKPKKKR